METLDLYETKVRLAEAELLMSAAVEVEENAKSFAEASVNTYAERSVVETKAIYDNTSIAIHYMKGLFVNDEVDWNLIKPKLAAYEVKRNPLGEAIEEKMGVAPKSHIFPPTIERGFPENTPAGKESFCKVKINFDPKILSKSEALSRLGNIREEANEDEEWAKDVFEYLKKETGYKFYFVVGFEIICEFDFKKYWTLRLKKVGNKKQELEGEISKIQDEISKIEGKSLQAKPEEKAKMETQARTKMVDEAYKLAEYAIEHVVEKMVYNDLRNAFKSMCEELEKNKKETTAASQ